jgi:uncharacterized protein with GYD domain
VKETTKRADAANSMAKKLGGTKFEIYYTMGESDLVALAEMPNDEAALQFDLWLGSLGNVRTRTMKAWTPEEFAKVVSKLQ